MTAPRPADRANRELRRTVDEDGVVKLELGPGGGATRVWIAAGAALLLALGGAAWLGLKGAPGREATSRVEPGGQARSRGSKRSSPDTNTNKSPKSRRSVPSPAGDPNSALENGEERAPAEYNSAPGATAPAEEEPDERGPAGRANDRHFNLPERAQGPDQKGIGAFPAPGTKRIKSGIVVPEDFPLPQGYVRHFQATDKGQMLQPILMFHPDYKPLDEAGNPIPLPADRVVPEDLAPPGLAVEYLKVPDDAYADSEGLAPEEGGEEGSGDSAP